MKYGWDLYAPDPKTRDNPYVSPLRASLDRLRGLPMGFGYSKTLGGQGAVMCGSRIAGPLAILIECEHLRSSRKYLCVLPEQIK